MRNRHFLKGLLTWFETQTDCNVYFWCPDSVNPAQKWQIGAHKNILSMTSDVFKGMFYGPLAHNTAQAIEVTMDYSTFKMLLTFIYGGKIWFDNIEVARDFFAAASYYACKDAMKYVMKYLWNNLNRENSIVCCEIGRLYCYDELKNAAWKVIGRDQKILERPKFLTASPDFVVELYQTQKFTSVQTEKEILVALERYVTHNLARDPNIMAKIRPAIQSIAFLTLKIEDVQKTILLTAHEKAGILMNLRANKDFMPEGFSKRSVPIEMVQGVSRMFVDTLYRGDGYDEYDEDSDDYYSEDQYENEYY
ncbi:uncharacterized protein LOC134831007 [Culicoides brevitarsis]|uniref:uncharacterized protein LOC134831007 n=1 Tax=Culicoides brevitarsis TaxID=469753 RepID=UPI00307C8F38